MADDTNVVPNDPGFVPEPVPDTLADIDISGLNPAPADETLMGNRARTSRKSLTKSQKPQLRNLRQPKPKPSQRPNSPYQPSQTSRSKLAKLSSNGSKQKPNVITSLNSANRSVSTNKTLTSQMLKSV